MTPMRLSNPSDLERLWGADWLSSYKTRHLQPSPSHTFPHTPHSMGPVAWFLKISPNPRSASGNGSPSAVSRLSSLVRRSSARPCEPGGKPRQTPPLSVSWDAQLEVSRPLTRSVSWSVEIEVFIIPARECALDDSDPPCVISAQGCAPDDCASTASTMTSTSSSSPARKIL